jgi:multiple sugar transport system substrate-binding protein
MFKKSPFLPERGAKHSRSTGATPQRLLKPVLVLLVVTLIIASFGPATARSGKSSMEGKSVQMSILGLAGWLPSQLGVAMANDIFVKYAKDKYGYDVSFTFAEAPFSDLFQKEATSLATKSQEYNILISDSQWIGALAQPGWIVKLNDIIKENPELDVKWYADSVRKTYQIYPDGSDQVWGFPEESDTIALFIRKDMLDNPDEQAAYKAKYGKDMPTKYEDFENMTMPEFEKLADFFTRPDKGLYGTAMQYGKIYDYLSCQLYPFMLSTGGQFWDSKTRQIYGVLNTDSNAKAMDEMKRWLKYQPPGALNYGIPEVIDPFVQGKVFSAFEWAALGQTMIPDALKGKVLVVPPPAHIGADGKPNRIYTIGGQPWVINAFNDADHMQVSIDFFKWWYLPETQLEFAKRGGNPSDAATLNSPGFDEIQPWFRAHKFMLNYSTDFWHDPRYSEMLAVQQDAWTGFMGGQVSSAEKALEYTACQQQKILYDEGNVQDAPPDSCADVTLQ